MCMVWCGSWVMSCPVLYLKKTWKFPMLRQVLTMKSIPQKCSNQYSRTMEGGYGCENFCCPCSTWLSSTFDTEQQPLHSFWWIRNSMMLHFPLWWIYIPMAGSEQMYFNLKHYEFIKDCRTDIDAFIVKSVQHITSLLQGKPWANTPWNEMWRFISVVLVWLKLTEQCCSGCFFIWDPQSGFWRL